MAYQKDNPPKGVLHVNGEGEFVDHIYNQRLDTHRIRAPMAHFWNMGPNGPLVQAALSYL